MLGWNSKITEQGYSTTEGAPEKGLDRDYKPGDPLLNLNSTVEIS